MWVGCSLDTMNCYVEVEYTREWYGFVFICKVTFAIYILYDMLAYCGVEVLKAYLKSGTSFVGECP